MDLSLLFRIFYSGFFTLLNIILVGLLLITPSDAIQQALSNHQLYNVFVIAGCYLLTLILAILIYASRLYTTRSVLAAIPKTWIPVEKGDVSDGVRKMIAESLTRSALIAWEARPRVFHDTDADGAELNEQITAAEFSVSMKKPSKLEKLFRKKTVEFVKQEQDVALSAIEPVWGEIAHIGWSSPNSLDLPNLQFITIVQELPHLIEAKAVSLAPADPDSSTRPPMPDLRAVDLLQRPAPMGLRDYVLQLASLGVLRITDNVTSFLSSYEYARFSSCPLSEPQFRRLMNLFAEILHVMSPLDPSLLDNLESESDIDDDVTSTTTSEISGSHSPTSSYSDSLNGKPGGEGKVNTARSRRIPTSVLMPVHQDVSAGSSPVGTRKNSRVVERSPSWRSFSQSRRPYPISQASNDSLRSTSETSIIRLSRSQTPADLPYIIQTGPH